MMDRAVTRERILILLIVSATTALLLLDVTVVNVALPVIRTDLDATFAEVQWAIDAYALALAAALLTAGAMADRLGRRRVLLGGLALFTTASAGCAAANSGLALDLARAAQGLGAAAMSAAGLALLAHEFQGRDRGLAFGVWGATTGAALAVGPLVGGLLVDGAGWRWIFLVNLPLGVALLAAGLRWLPESREPQARALDLPGLVTFAATCVLVTFPLIRGNEDGWTSAPVLGAAAGAVVALALFVLAERRAAAPMLPLALLRTPGLAGAALVSFAQSVVIYPLLLFLAFYLQDGLAYSASEAGLRLLPITLVIFAAAPVSGRLTARVALRWPLCAALLIAGASAIVMRFGVAGDAMSWTGLLPGFILAGLAVGVISPALAAAMVAALPVQRSGMSSGITNTARQLGIAVGVAGLGAIFRHEADAAAGLPGLAAGLDAVLLTVAAIAVVSVVPSWLLLGRLSSPPAEP